MKLILLPGNSPKNRDWIDDMRQMLASKFDSSQIQYYDHWKNGGGFSVKTERQKLVDNVKKNKKYAIFAKSVGVFLALDTTQKELISPSFCIFAGTTTRSAELLDDWHVPTLFIQEEQDPFLHYSELAEVVHEIGDNQHELLVIPGTRHWYDKITSVKKNVSEYISTQK